MIPNVVIQLLKNFVPDINSIQNIKSPDDMAQYLLNTGKVNQSQVNQVRQMWNNPQVQQQINNMRFPR